jgi:flagellar protein FliO/FliZ
LLRSRIIYKKGIPASKFDGAVTITNDGPILSIHVADRNAPKPQAVLPKKLPPKLVVGANSPAPGEVAKSAQETSSPFLLDENELHGVVEARAQKSPVAKTAEAQIVIEGKPSTRVSTPNPADMEADEAKIPILTEKKVKTKKGSSNLWLRVMISLVVVMGLFVGLALAAKRWVKKSATTNGNQNIKILTQHYIGPKKSLAIIRVAGESILIGVTDHNISLIKTLSLLDEELPEISSNDFSKSLLSAQEDEDEDAGLDEDFAIRGVRDIVKDRLRGMRKI